MKSYKGIRNAFCFMCFRGLSFGLNIMNVFGSDKKLYSLYALRAEAGKILIMDTSLYYDTLTSLELEDPRFFDEVAADFPELKIITSDLGVVFGVPMALAIALHLHVGECARTRIC